jgi:transcriptional regulator with XRE-family HTH domain
MSYGDLIKDIRVRSQLTLRQFAAILGVTPVYVSDIERMNRAPLGTDKTLLLLNIPGVTQKDIDDLLFAATSERRAVQVTVPENVDAQVALSGMARGGFSDEQWKDLREFVEKLRRDQ